MSRIATSPADLRQLLSTSLRVTPAGAVEILDAAQLQKSGAATIAWTAAFGTDDATIAAAQWLARAAAAAAGIQSASIAPLYAARAENAYEGPQPSQPGL